MLLTLIGLSLFMAVENKQNIEIFTEILASDKLTSYQSSGYNGQNLFTDDPSYIWQQLFINPALAMLVYDSIEERDGIVSACLETRRNGVLSKPRRIKPASDSAEDKKIADFGVTPKRFESLFTKSEAVFKKIKVVLEKNRQRELNKLREEYATLNHPIQEEKDEIAGKYQNLINNYRDRPELLSEIFEWKSQALSPYNTYIANQRNSINYISTPLKERVESFELVDFNLREIRNARKRMAEIRDEYGIENEHSYYGVPPEIKEEFEYVSRYNWKLLIAPYVFVHDLEGFDDENLSLEYVLRGFSTSSGLNFINWGVVCFEPNHKYWVNQVSDELKEIIYTNFTIFDDAVNITPIENRLKDELDARKIKYKIQYPYKGYILDFFLEVNGKCIDVECDGKEYHSSQDAIEHDRIRNNVMAANSIYVLRFSGSEIWNNVKSCVDLIENALQ